ncbi:hypothetical protein B0H13DRAFT_1933421 [Mycena leptocephala]|nr:hypothetical protein B0H13DRAFT_1933421 [Mycena leptocephala]
MASQAEKIYSIALAASVHSATDWTIFGASKPISLLYASAWTTRDCSSSINFNRSASRLSGAEYNIYLKLLGVKGLDNEHHALRARPGHARDHPSSINLDQSDSRLSGAAYDIYLGLCSIEFNRSAPRLPHTVHNMYIEPPNPRARSQTRGVVGEPVPRQSPSAKIRIWIFSFFSIWPCSLRSPRATEASPPTLVPKDAAARSARSRHRNPGFFFSHPVRLYLPAKGALRGPFSLPNARERWGRSGIKTAKKKVFFFLFGNVGRNRRPGGPARPPERRAIDSWGARTLSALFFLATGRSSGLGKPPPTLANPPLVASDVGGPAVHKAARFYPKPTISRTRISLAPVNLTFVVPLILHHLPAAPPPFLDLLPPSWSALQAFLIPLGLPQRSDHSHDPERAMNNAAYGYGLERRAPYAKEGPGSCYNIACIDDADIALYRVGGITGADLLARMTWKIGHSNDHEQRRREYGRCDVGQTHIWVCRWEVDRRYYCERLAQLEQLCDGGEYFTFPSVRGFAQFRALMTGVLLFMNEPLTPIFYQPSPEIRDIYNLIIQS